jgi:hypothetical protein
MGQLVDAWRKLQMDMEVDRLQMQIDTQQKMLEAQKSIRDKHNNKKSMEEKTTKLNIQNIQKLENQRLVDATYYPRIESIEERDNEYVFSILVDSGLATHPIKIKMRLQRNKQFTNDYGENYYRVYYGDNGELDTISSKCISNPECFKEKLVDMVGVDSLRNLAKAYFTDTTSVSGGDSAKLQQISDLLNSI